MKTLRLVFTFYRSFAFVGCMISLLCLPIILENGVSSIAPLFWFKILTLGLFYYFLNNYKEKEYYYYQNLGLSKKKLWLLSILIDLLIFILISLIAIKFK